MKKQNKEKDCYKRKNNKKGFKWKRKNNLFVKLDNFKRI